MDYSPYCHQRQDERSALIHRHHDTLLRLKRASSSLLLPIRLRFRRYGPLDLSSLALTTSIGMCAFGIIIGDTIPHVIRSLFPKLETVPVLSIFANRQFIIALCTLCVSYPLSLYRDIHKLSRASGLALVGMIIIVVSVIIEGQNVKQELKGDPSKRYSILQPGIFQAIGVISFAFGTRSFHVQRTYLILLQSVCHHNSLLIYGSLRTPTLDRFATVTHISTAMSLVACCTLAISAFLVFTNKTQGNILNNFSPVGQSSS